MRLMDHPIADRIRDAGLPNGGVPCRWRELAGDERRGAFACELAAVVDMSSAARRRRDAAPVNGHQWSATFRSDNGYGGASAAIEAEASMCASISR